MNRDEALRRLGEICDTLPEADASGDQHRAFTVRKKTFAYFLDDHRADGRLALNCKAAPGRNTSLVDEDSVRFHIPAYLGPRGWAGVWLDAPDVDWDRVEELVLDAYRLTAPKRLVRELNSR